MQLIIGKREDEYGKICAAFKSPLGNIRIESEDGYITAVYFDGEKIDGHGKAIDKAKDWLEEYFLGRNPKMDIGLMLKGTEFQLRVWEELMSIPYGTTITYGELAKRIGSHPHPVGQAMKRNRIMLLLPCHRVVASNGLGGYAGREYNKLMLLQIEELI